MTPEETSEEFRTQGVALSKDRQLIRAGGFVAFVNERDHLLSSGRGLERKQVLCFVQKRKRRTNFRGRSRVTPPLQLTIVLLRKRDIYGDARLIRSATGCRERGRHL